MTLDLNAAKSGTSDASLAQILASLAGNRVTVTISGTAGMKFKNASSLTAHAEDAWRSVDGGWQDETVSYYVDITAENASSLADAFFTQVTFMYGFDSSITEVKAVGFYTITATVSYGATPAQQGD